MTRFPGRSTFADNYTPIVPGSYRIANLCDFVPSMVSLEPVIPSDPYVHVGIEGTFVWRKWDDGQSLAGEHLHANGAEPELLEHHPVGFAEVSTVAGRL